MIRLNHLENPKIPLYPIITLPLDVPNSSNTLHVPRGNRYSGILPGEGYIGIRALVDFSVRLKYPTATAITITSGPVAARSSCARMSHALGMAHVAYDARNRLCS